MARQFSVLFFVLLTQETVHCIKVQVGTQEPVVAEGRDATLTCQFDIPEDRLYSLKWYKGNKQFYSYVPSRFPRYRTFYAEGVTINVSHSSPQDVTLTGVTKETAGLYRCEVIGESPLFPISSAEKYIEVHLLPEDGPFIEGAQKTYSIGDLVDVNCTSKPSRPVTHLVWWIDNEIAEPSHSEYISRVEGIDATSTAIRLTFRIGAKNIPQLTLMCVATIGLAYHSSTEHRARVLLPRPQPPVSEFAFKDNYGFADVTTNSFDEDDDVDKNAASSTSSRGFFDFLYLLLISINYLI